MEGIGKQLGDQLQCNQGESIVELRGCLSVNMGPFEQMKYLCKRLSDCYKGDPQWDISPIPLPLKKQSDGKTISFTRTLQRKLRMSDSKSDYLKKCKDSHFEVKAAEVALSYRSV